MRPILAVLAGGTSPEREVSLGSGRACALALARFHPVRLFRVDADALPQGLDPGTHVVFSTLHGTFGEDGGMQRLLDAAGVQYAGCGAESSALTMDKTVTKEAAGRRGVRVSPSLLFEACARPSVEQVTSRLGSQVVIKPNNQGSSVGLSIARGPDEIAAALGRVSEGRWLAESYVAGRELSVGLLGGKAMGVVEIRPRSGVYDYSSKYTKGLTEYLAPAPLEAEVAAAVRSAAEATFEACGCRDYARADFILERDREPILLEINTLPGMKETSLLPMSARCAGLDFAALVRELVKPALERFASTASLARR